ncbi:hypothetical protein VTJ83DRAFT_7171 [Remersonia thermophila]|uniref:Tr-type G domain-containing protein n=1 Tax=Remersonia thermophila TaxID=72144 RepID=A0ABR4D2Q4_9PEZI
MSRHQYIRNLDYQDVLDEYEGYSDEEDDELSPEDRELMTQGTAAVQAALGVEASKVTVAQIEEALWHYYYDVDKSVAYLISKFVNPAPKPAKTQPHQRTGKLATRAFSTVDHALLLDHDLPTDWATKTSNLTDAAPPATLGFSSSVGSRCQASSRTGPSLAHLFHDMPWGNVPAHRSTTFVPPLTPRGGLLGGSGTAPKMSKLQALAAARKKKAQEQSAASNAVAEAVVGLNELSVRDAAGGNEGAAAANPPSKRFKTSAATSLGSLPSLLASKSQTAAARPSPGEAPERLPSAPPPTQPAPSPGLRGTPAESCEATATADDATTTAPSSFGDVLSGIRSSARPTTAAAESKPWDRVEIDFDGPLYGVDGRGKAPPEDDRSSLDWFEVRRRKRGDSDLYEDVVVLFPNLPQSARDAFAKPSPDDIVLAAQAKSQTKAGQKTTPASKAKKTAPAAGTGDAKAEEPKAVEAPLPKSRNLDVLSEFEKHKGKKSASFVVVGHVDAGKSTMMGRLLLDLSVVDQRTVEKLRKEAQTIGKSSFALAWVLDQRAEERTRGVTIDIATNRFETDKTIFTVLDAPGHQDFIPNMIAGASQADFAILVIDAGVGAFEAGLKGQTREHSLLIRSMGVSRIIVAVNKLDMVSWSQERFEEIKNQMAGFLSMASFQAKNISFVPVSGLYGDNLVRRSANPAAAWYTGPTLVEELESSEPSARALTNPLRITASEVYRTMQSPVTVAGRVDAGSLQVGDALLVQPSGEKAYVKSLLADDAPAEWAVAGQSVVLHLSHIDPIHVRVGDIICDPAKPVARSDRFTMKALAFDFLTPMQVDVHRGRLHAAGRIDAIPALLDKVTGAVANKKPKIVKPGTVARIVVQLEAPVPLEAGQRVVLRSGGQTVAAGLLE